jgi:hypothetical protein
MIGQLQITRRRSSSLRITQVLTSIGATAITSRATLASAIADYTKITELEPSNSNYVLYLGISKYRAGDFNGAARSA